MVTNALSPEEKPIIENIISLFQQLLTLQGDAAPTEEIVEMAQEENPDERDPAQAVDVEKATKETGDSKAEERLDEQTDTTESALGEIKKSIQALTNMTGRNRVVKKSRTVNKSSAVLNELKKMNQVLSTVVKAQQTQDAFNQQIMDGIGLGDEIIQKSMPKKEESTKPFQSNDVNAFVEMMANAFKSAMGEQKNDAYNHPFNQKRQARKSLRQIAEYIHYNK